MCNRLGKRKFFERYKKTRQQLRQEMAVEKDMHGRPLYNNYLPNILIEHGFQDDRLYCPNNMTRISKHRPARMFALERLSLIWLTCYSGVKRRVNRKSYYAALPAMEAALFAMHKEPLVAEMVETA